MPSPAVKRDPRRQRRRARKSCRRTMPSPAAKKARRRPRPRARRWRWKRMPSPAVKKARRRRRRHWRRWRESSMNGQQDSIPSEDEAAELAELDDGSLGRVTWDGDPEAETLDAEDEMAEGEAAEAQRDEQSPEAARRAAALPVPGSPDRWRAGARCADRRAGKPDRSYRAPRRRSAAGRTCRGSG